MQGPWLQAAKRLSFKTSSLGIFHKQAWSVDWQDEPGSQIKAFLSDRHSMVPFLNNGNYMEFENKHFI